LFYFYYNKTAILLIKINKVLQGKKSFVRLLIVLSIPIKLTILFLLCLTSAVSFEEEEKMVCTAIA